MAHGAALYAATRLAQKEGRTPPWEIAEVDARHSLGIVGVDTRTGEKLNITLIPRDTRLPTARIPDVQDQGGTGHAEHSTGAGRECLVKGLQLDRQVRD